MKDAMSKIEEAAKLNNASGDMALIYGFMRMQDPTSTVREGEYATAENARGVPESVMNLYNKVLKGTKLSDRQRAEFTSTARSQFDIMDRNQKTLEQQYTKVAQDYGLDPERIIGRAVKTLDTDKTDQTGTVTTIKSDDEYNKIPSGSVFIGPDGKKRTKP